MANNLSWSLLLFFVGTPVFCGNEDGPESSIEQPAVAHEINKQFGGGSRNSRGSMRFDAPVLGGEYSEVSGEPLEASAPNLQVRDFGSSGDIKRKRSNSYGPSSSPPEHKLLNTVQRLSSRQKNSPYDSASPQQGTHKVEVIEVVPSTLNIEPLPGQNLLGNLQSQGQVLSHDLDATEAFVLKIYDKLEQIKLERNQSRGMQESQSSKDRASLTRDCVQGGFACAKLGVHTTLYCCALVAYIFTVIKIFEHLNTK